MRNTNTKKHFTTNQKEVKDMILTPPRLVDHASSQWIPPLEF